MMKSLNLQVTGFQEVSAARKRRQASETKAMAVFEAFAEVSEDAVLEDVEGAVENEIKSAADEELESLDADSFNIIGAVVGTITTVPTTCLTTVSTTCPACPTSVATTCPSTVPTTCPTTVPAVVQLCPVCSTDCDSQRVEHPTWSSWKDANACQPDGTRIRTRYCGKDGADSNECPGESSEIIYCTPRKCINIACDCDFQSNTFGKKNGVCSGKNFFNKQQRITVVIKLKTIFIFSRSQFGKYHRS